MPDQTDSAAPVENATEPTLGEAAVELASTPEADPWDAVIDKAGIKDDDAPEPDATADPADDADADAADTAGDAEIEAGIAELARMPGMTAERARRLLSADPELVREYGRDALARTPETDPADPDPAAEAPAKPEAKADDAPAVPDAEIAEILGEVLDKVEVEALTRVFDRQKAALLAEFKKLVPDTGELDKRLTYYDAALSELYGRRVVDEMASDFPELKERGAYEKVHQKAVAMRQAGVKAPVRELVEMAVIALHGGKARAEIAAHRGKITRAKSAGTPSTPKVGDPDDKRSQFDKDFDLAWDKALKR